MAGTLRVLIVDDSKVVSKVLKFLLETEDDIQVVGCAYDGEEAIKLTHKLKPDVITMDIQMPKLDGYQTTSRIMHEIPTPIVVVSALVAANEMETTYNALQAGALAVIEKPADVFDQHTEKTRANLVNMVRAMSEIKVIRRRGVKHKKAPVVRPKTTLKKQPTIIALGASTGGPEALVYLIGELPEDYPLPIVVVQHICDGFLPSFVNWLQAKSAMRVHIAQNNDELLPGNVYFAPDHYHLTVADNNGLRAVLDRSKPVGGFRPSINRLFTTLATALSGVAVGGLLTGMGNDGAQGLLMMRQSGCYTFAQNEASSVVFGMPGQAQSLGAACDMLDIADIPQHLQNLATGV